QLRHGRALPGGPDSATQVRGRRAAAGHPTRAGRADAPARWAHRQARRRLREPGTDGSDAPVRPGGLVWRAHRGARLQRFGQVALPAAVGRRWQRPRTRTPPGRRRDDRTRGAHRHGAAGRPRASGLVRPDTRSPRADGPDTAVDPAPRRRSAGRAAQRGGRWVLDRYELARAGDQTFESLSGGQQARLQILLLELSGATLLLLDEPTDNLDLVSAEALQDGLAAFEGTVLAVTHDRWFARDFDRYVVFGADGSVYESPEPVWDEGRVTRTR